MLVLASLFSLLFAQSPTATATPAPDSGVLQIIDGKPVRVIINKNEHIDLDGAKITGDPKKGPIGIAVGSREAEPFEKQIPDKKNFGKELRKSLD